MISNKPTLYIETTVIIYYTSRPSTNVILRGHQEITKLFWENNMRKYDPCISLYVMQEIEKGDKERAAKRKSCINHFALLEITPMIETLAKVYSKELKIPGKAKMDAFHLATAVHHEIDYLVTWNFTHLSNGWIRRQLDKINNRLGIKTSIICSPEELMEAQNV
ncbi:MAG: hypothetical protein A2268_13475 [Candidatus Raymondbacteria bacterium RifOxyA12_full_50_37]|uniref:Uncharacterized protein n=1 Tax=Candidatus Raymondbacteria bacterium RIFOXYD12_FULL_49_13 TaxID=1817890 RepID=A0A1F7F8V5_UNCRA|nr:MAG: hypothetical protein A2268_13475 [Candidatus Raymondbacteria bacterium RifOxyA12_full_50_37]OGJ91520.1 MAG: hypothetical protein A2248_03720 [Candidatus Raymondbacteria bacterium RIFOXYA2_FULL_49_16]OGJ93070.1 MAG: hypothetical protein A2350_04820 [Candidatus Raymondbacteria bacterium RifOxyB12_full_50_8]OGJ97834.1 MAG: hypothetical protein A2453_14105 [Candidatus Raymondbacteria bacterium RIFOXYC2_FULL_50_21]OGK02121.1 MAG: hypothetical protein A2487_20965 [Candidatus Raymondbacteria b